MSKQEARRRGVTDAEPLALNVAETARLLGISAGYAYRMVREGLLPAYHLGGRVLIPRAALLKMMETEVQLPPMAHRSTKEETAAKKSAAGAGDEASSI